MILSDESIRKLLREGRIKVEPFEESLIQPSSLDLRLGEEVGFYEGLEEIDVKKEGIPFKVKKIEKSFTIKPKEFCLATTLEYIKLPEDITAFVEGRSSLGRLGLFIENAGWVDAGFEGRITLELFNANNIPIKLYKGMKICQLVFAKLDSMAKNPYRGKYKGQRGVMSSKIFLEF